MRKIFVLLSVSITVFSCDNQEPKSYPELFDLKVNEILQIITHSSSDTITNCRTFFISKGNACGPLFVYSISDIDTVLLMNKFIELGELKANYYNEMEKQGTPLGVCDLALPDTLVIMNGRCRACFKNEIQSCEDTSIWYY